MNTRRSISILITFAGAASGAAGQTLSWANPAGGAASTAGNWSPAGVPGAANDLVWNLVAGYPVTFSAATTASRTHTYRRGTVTLTMSTPHTAGSGVTVGDLAGDAAITTLTSGTWSSGGPATIGDAAGASGTLSVNDDDADFIVTAAGSAMTVGSNGAGTLNVTGGGLVQTAGQFVAGNNAASLSTVLISGATSTLPVVRSTLRATGAAPTRFGQGGDATVTISNGGLADLAGDLVISNGSASTSTVTVSGVGGIVPTNALLDVGGDLLVGRNSSAGPAAGAGTLSVDAGGRVAVGGTMFLAGDPDGGTGTLHLAVGGRVTTHSLDIGAGSTLDLDGGELIVDGGVLAWGGFSAQASLHGGAGSPELSLTNGAAAAFTTGLQDLEVGGGAGANSMALRVLAGSDVTVGIGSLAAGEGADDSGSLLVSGPGSTLALDPRGSSLIVGAAGVGTLTVGSGAAVTGDDLVIAQAAGSNGIALFQNAGSSGFFNSVFVGGSSSAPGGPGVLAVGGGADLSLSVSGNMRVHPAGRLEAADGGTVHAPSTDAVIHGELRMQPGGLVSVRSAHFAAGGLLSGPTVGAGLGTLDASVAIAAGSRVGLTLGDLTAGDASSQDGFVAAFGSGIDVASRTLTLLDADGADVADVALGGGTLASNARIVIATNANIDGTGTLTAPEVFFSSGGSVITATGEGGITINGILHNNSGSIDGTKFTFNEGGAGGGWIGAGTIGARVVFNAGTSVNARANMTLGLHVIDGVTFNAGSELHAGTKTVTLVDSNGAGLPSVTDVNGGRVVCTRPLTVAAGRRLSGRGGSIDAPTVTVLGELAPGELVGIPAGQTGELTINGDLVLGAGAATNLELGGLLGPVQYDRVTVNGSAALAGVLNVTEVDGFQLPSGESLVIMSADSMTGGFSAVNIPPAYSIDITPTLIVIGHCVADFNGDGFIDFFDYDDFVECFETFNEGVCANGGNPDTNRDGFVDFFDYDDYVQAFETGC